MPDEIPDPFSPEMVEKNKINRIISILAVAVVLCICICFFVLIVLPTVFDPIIGDVLSEIIDDTVLTPIY